MCGIVGVVAHAPVNQLLYDALLLLQHRGQDAAGIATVSGNTFNAFRSRGQVRDIFRTRNMRSLPGTSGIGQVRYPTAGSSEAEDETQPLYVNAPFGIVFAHNGNLTNHEELRQELFRIDRRHINTNSDSEVLLNVLAHELQEAATGVSLDSDAIFRAVSQVHRRARGAYAVVAYIAGYGLLAFRDPHGIRPLVIGRAESAAGPDWMVASESVALEPLGYTVLRDVAPGEAIFISLDGSMEARQCADKPQLLPCAFEYIYLARPDSMLDGVSVYASRLRMGESLGARVARQLRLGEVDVVMPIPDSARPAAMQLASSLSLEYREGLIKNRYVGRTFIMPGQAVRKRSVRQKLNTIGEEFKGKNVLLVDDSIVRGTTSGEIVDMARAAGANKVFFASAAPPVRYPNVYGIDMPTHNELIAYGRSDEEVAQIIGADALIYQDLADMKRAIGSFNSAIEGFEASCFDGHYVTGDIDAEHLARLEHQRQS